MAEHGREIFVGIDPGADRCATLGEATQPGLGIANALPGQVTSIVLTTSGWKTAPVHKGEHVCYSKTI